MSWALSKWVLWAGTGTGVDTGMLVVESVVPGGPAAGILEPGDVLVRVEGHVTTHFQPLEALLDSCVGQSAAFEVERGGSKITANVQVGF